MTLAALTLLVLTHASDGVQLSAGPVLLYGGKSRQGDVIWLLDVGEEGRSSRIIEFSWRQPSSPKVLPLQAAPKPLETQGIARPGDGAIWILADKGRSVARFDEMTGKLLRFDPLPQPAEGIWDFEQRVILALMQLHGGEPLLASAETGGIRPFTNLRSRKGSSAVEVLTGNLFSCGLVESSRFPCWWGSGSPDGVIIKQNEETVAALLPSLIKDRPSPPLSASSSLESIEASLRFPVRDMFLLQGDSFWVLTNQESSRPITEQGSVRARHVIRVDNGRSVKTVELPKTGWAILAGDEKRLLLLYRDGSIAWLNCQ